MPPPPTHTRAVRHTLTSCPYVLDGDWRLQSDGTTNLLPQGFGGTLFRFPLRTEQHAEVSDICILGFGLILAISAYFPSFMPPAHAV